MQIEIRQLADQDFEGLCTLITSTYSDTPIAMRFQSMPTKEELLELFRKKREYVKEGKAVDVVAVKKDSRYDKICGECEIIIEKEVGVGAVGIIVERQCRRKGIGSKLLKHATVAAKSLGIIKLVAEVDKRNTQALSFFESNLFKPLQSKAKTTIIYTKNI